MNLRVLLISLSLAALWLGNPVSAAAHRVDEYLQATRIAVARDRVGLEILLTPGESVAPLVFSWIDTNHDGRISSVEGVAYSQEVLRSVDLAIDGRPISVVLMDQTFPEFREMSLGVGTIRLHAAVRTPPATNGPHRVFYRNTHRPEWSVYLANALVPDDDRIEIGEQHRDRAQRELAVDYRVVPGAASAVSLWHIVGLPLAALAGLAITLFRSPTTPRGTRRRRNMQKPLSA